MTWDEAYEQFDDMIEDFFGDVVICGYTYSPGRALRELDPIAYTAEFLIWADLQAIDTDELVGHDKMADR